MAYAGNSVYWLGADGNVWFKHGGNVQNVGKPVNLQNNGFDSNRLSAVATRINDPNPPQQPAPANPNGGGGGTASPATPDKSRDIALQNAGLAALDTQEETGLGGVNKSLSTIMGQYADEAAKAGTNYTTQSNTNQGNFQTNKQSAFVNAAAGRQGLAGTLASLGALNGSGLDLMTRAVQKGANEDLSGASDTFESNKTGLDTAYETFTDEDKRRQENAKLAAENMRTNIKNQTSQNRQKFYSNLSDDYSAQGDDTNAQKYGDLAAGAYKTIADTSVGSPALAHENATFTPGTLANYLAGSDSTQVTATPTNGTGGLPGLVATGSNKKKKAAGAAV